MLVLSGTTVDADHWCTYNAEDVSKLTDTSVQTLVNRKNSYLKDKHAMTFRWVPMFIRLIWWAFFFSSVSAFNIGFRDVNFGRWLRLLTRKEFDLKATGWVRVVSGFQALSSVYLVGFWILSFAGTPFK
ncbi:MAG: hypothetical protein KKG33_00755 [candidate division Zixibacteria bacterium]|nr:hypothetical protein [candidate division Zixibacteria bacterium]MBU1469271.1 hypothetical protein [candidate division Zixibacteria bacterium]MBU2624068.1 hypothetical protein [candidate division Zixibacteria bacterium]